MLLKRLFSRCKERITYILILSLFWLIVLIMNNPFESDKGYAQSIQKMGEESIGATSVLQKGNAVSQTFIASDDRLESVNVLVAAYQRTNNAKVKVTVQDSANNIIYCETQDTSAWSDNTYFTFHFARQNNSRGKKYTILFEGIDGDESNSPALWYTNATASLKNTIENGEEKNYALMVTATYWKPVLATGYIVCWAVLILLSYIFMLFLRTADEKTFLAFSILLGSLFVVLNPFFHVLDEGTHFLKSFSISRFDWLNDVSNGKIGSYVPENYSKVIQFESTDIKSLFDTNLSQTYFSENQVFYENPYVASVIPINHAIAAVGILFGRLLHMSVLGIIWAGRLANYIYYTVLCYFAIKNAKYYKSIFFDIANSTMACCLLFYRPRFAGKRFAFCIHLFKIQILRSGYLYFKKRYGIAVNNRDMYSFSEILYIYANAVGIFLNPPKMFCQKAAFHNGLYCSCRFGWLRHNTDLSFKTLSICGRSQWPRQYCRTNHLYERSFSFCSEKLLRLFCDVNQLSHYKLFLQ